MRTRRTISLDGEREAKVDFVAKKIAREKKKNPARQFSPAVCKLIDLGFEALNTQTSSTKPHNPIADPGNVPATLPGAA